MVPEDYLLGVSVRFQRISGVLVGLPGGFQTVSGALQGVSGAFQGAPGGIRSASRGQEISGVSRRSLWRMRGQEVSQRVVGALQGISEGLMGFH